MNIYSFIFKYIVSLVLIVFGLIVWEFFGLGQCSKSIDVFYDIKKNKNLKR